MSMGSAAEIFLGKAKDGAPLAGTPPFNRGMSQTFFPSQNYSRCGGWYNRLTE